MMETTRSTDFWIDTAELARVGEVLAGTRGQSGGGELDEPVSLLLEDDDGEGGDESTREPHSADAGAGVSDIGRIGKQLAEIRQRAERSGLLRPGKVADGGTEEPEEVALPGSGASLVERLESFVSWAAAQGGLTGLFISDFGANELVESGADPVLVNSGVALAAGWERARGELEETHTNGVSTPASVRDSEGAVLTVYSCRSAYGQHVLGVLSPGPLARTLSMGLRAGFARVMGQGEA